MPENETLNNSLQVNDSSWTRHTYWVKTASPKITFVVKTIKQPRDIGTEHTYPIHQLPCLRAQNSTRTPIIWVIWTNPVESISGYAMGRIFWICLLR
ncbi:hypothetical protein CDAR_272781 [Caerostris darwini]|uniref:Uncharacterized protein n=1 Tax=Caerostris darwini TaxID=1538125 RepID=A0AAV4UZE9_9ARAC|nr:hypothetical protein CDAR_272781 [Caerostris darwini]